MEKWYFKGRFHEGNHSGRNNNFAQLENRLWWHEDQQLNFPMARKVKVAAVFSFSFRPEPCKVRTH
jgi:hypothetical protein